MIERTRRDASRFSAENAREQLENEAANVEATRSAYADTLLDILRREGVPTTDGVLEDAVEPPTKTTTEEEEGGLFTPPPPPPPSSTGA